MKPLLFLDTASIEEIIYWNNFGLVDGVTTNPILLSKESGNAYNHLKKICSIVKGPVSAQVTEKNSLKMIKQAKILKSIGKNVVIKLPCTLEGAKAAKIISKQGYKINITLSFEPSQYLIFRNINITYFSFIIGRVEDFGKSNIENVYSISKLIKKFNPKTKLLSASIRNSEQLNHALLAGSEAITVPPSTWKKIFLNEFSISGEKDFLNTWEVLSSERRKGYEIKK